MPYKQDARLFELSTPLGEDELVIKEFSGREQLSQCFLFELRLVSHDDQIDAEKLITQRVTLRIETNEGERHWTGFVSVFERVGEIKIEGEDDIYTEYRCEIVPLMAFLQRNEEARIFQNKNARDIVEALFQEFKLTDYEFHLSGTYDPIEYCVQYHETTLAFIERVLSRAGIYYFFRHEAEREVLVLTDNRDNHPELEQKSITFHSENITAEDIITSLKRRQSLRTGRITMRDYNFEKPQSPIEVSVETLIRSGDNSNYERYLYPGGFTQRDEGETLARLMMEGEEADHEMLDGGGNVRLMTPGYSFELEGHPDSGLNEEQLVVSVEHSGRNNLGRDSGHSTYSNRFSLMPARVQYRPLPSRRRARVEGPHTAVVVGPPGEEIYTDKYGRVKVKFHWDRSPNADDKSSCWLRVAQSWAGRQFGAFFLPRIGMEVLVDFIEGDPDRPLVTGCLYNADNMPPYDLPAEATKSTLKTNSSKGGGGFNELRFEDKKGSEQIFVNAQKDTDIRIGNDSREWVERDRHLVVKRDRLEEAHGDQHGFVKGNRVGEVQGDDHLSVTGLQAKKVSGSMSLKVEGAVGESFQTHAEETEQDYYLKAGTNIVIEAGMQITLKVGSNFIVIDPSGVTIQGTMTMINSGGSPGSGTPGSLVPPLAATPADPAATAKAGGPMQYSPLGETRPKAPPNDAQRYDPSKSSGDGGGDNSGSSHYFEVELVDDNGKPIPGEPVTITLADGKTIANKVTDEKGIVRLEGVDPGQCQVTFPRLDEDSWK